MVWLSLPEIHMTPMQYATLKALPPPLILEAYGAARARLPLHWTRRPVIIVSSTTPIK